MAIKKIDGQKVHCMAKVKASNTDKVGIGVAWIFNFEGCKNDAILHLAARSLVIDQQREYRTSKPNERKSLINKEFLVRDMLKAKRTKKTPTVSQVVDVMAGMTDAERNEILAKYGKK